MQRRRSYSDAGDTINSCRDEPAGSGKEWSAPQLFRLNCRESENKPHQSNFETGSITGPS